MRFICADYESYFDDTFTLKKLSTENYIRDPRFEIHGIAVKWSKDHDAKWYTREEWKYLAAQEDWSDVFMVHHHANFDGLISSHHYGINPKTYGCTLSMARLLIGNHLSVSLDSVRKHFGMPAKSTPYNLFKGKHWRELTAHEQQALAEGCCDEVESIWKLFGLLAKEFPAEEYEVVDQVVRMFVNPVLRADINLLADLWEKEEREKSGRLSSLGITAGELASADRFANLLRAEGIEPETKAGKNGPIYAFAKTDEFMRGLLEHDDVRIRTLAEARLGEKSTLLQTRAETFGNMGNRGALPVYLRYAGAGTLRPSGGDKTGFLNLKRGSDLRRAILAPPGYLLGPCDASQIEVRVGAYLAGEERLLEKFRKREDPYVDLASEFYGERVYKPAKDDPRRAEMEMKRGAGKQAILMCQYGAAAPKYRATAKAGLYGPPIDMPLEEAECHVRIYRDTYQAICARNTGYWAQAGRALARLAGGDPMEWGPLTIRNKRIYLPPGQVLLYDTLEYHVPTDDENPKEFERQGYWRVKTRQGWKTMWGSKLFQNLCEAVSRVIVSQAMIRCARMGYRALNWPYDELLFLIPKDAHEEEHLERCRLEMCKAPEWLPGIPLDADASLGERYSK